MLFQTRRQGPMACGYSICSSRSDAKMLLTRFGHQRGTIIRVRFTVMPTRAGGTVRESALTVLNAYSTMLFYFFFSCYDPQSTMLGFSKQPYKRMLFFWRAAKTAPRTFSVMRWHSSAECLPSERISGSTIGTNPFYWQMAAYLANPHAFSLMERSVGHPSPIFKTALHFANRHPSLQNYFAIAGKASNPLVQFSPFPFPPITPNPLSTLMPATMPFDLTYSTKLTPSLVACLAVSSWKITPEIYSSAPGVVMSISLYLLLFSALFQSLIATNFFSTEVGDSSAANIPFPGVQILLAVSINSLEQSSIQDMFNLNNIVLYTQHNYKQDRMMI